MLDHDFLDRDRDETVRRLVNHRETNHDDELEALPAPDWPSGTHVGGYQIDQVIGSGKYSTVYAVHEIKTGNPLALKLLRTRSTASILTNRLGFRRMQPLSHPSLIKLGQLVRLDHYHGMTMERVHGRRLCDETVALRKATHDHRFAFVYELLRQIGGALSVMHSASLVHRDVKPDNIMYDQRGRFRLIDYGIVGQCDPESDPDARRNYLAGTVWYMAPESIYDQIYPPACDVYSLGCVALELLADHTRLPQQQQGASLGQVVRDARLLLLPDTPADLVELINDMIDIDAKNRPLAARVARIGIEDTPKIETEHKVKSQRCYGRDSFLHLAERWANDVANGRTSRLHVSGSSGVGKSWFLDELKRRLRLNAWFQVFDSACVERTDLPLHTFDSIVDLITKRYSRDDRDPIRLSAISASILCQAFPALQSIIEVQDPQTAEEIVAYFETTETINDESLALNRYEANLSELNSIRTEALQAGLDFTNQLSSVGPMFLVIDDIQWADRDSINMLEKILAEANGPVGLITVGRDQQDPFLDAPDLHIELSLLSTERCVEMLESIFEKYGMTWESRALTQLAMLSGGNISRLTQLAACIVLDRPLYWHQRLCHEVVEIEEIWQGRIDLVSPQAKLVLECLAIAEGPTQLTDLEQLYDWQDSLSQTIDELLNLYLIVESKTDFCVVDIVHQRVRDRLLQGIDAQRAASIHYRWANHFKQFDDREWIASRIAGHLLKAQCPAEAFDYVVQAANEADLRFAFTDAARWHRASADLCDGEQSLRHRCLAISKFEKAGQPLQAAVDCQALLQYPQTVSSPWVLRMIYLRQAHNLLQGGQFVAAQRALQQAQSSGPGLEPHQRRPDASSDPLWDFVCESESICRVFHQPLFLIDPQQAQTAWQLARQWVMRTDQEARAMLRADLNFVRELRGSAPQRTSSDTPSSVALIAPESSSQQISSPEPLDAADVSGRQAIQHWLQGNWLLSIQSVDRARAASATSSVAPPLLHPSLLTLVESWSNFWLGRLGDQSKHYRQAMVQVRERNDEILRRCLFTGVGVTNLLLQDQVSAARAVHVELCTQLPRPRSRWSLEWEGLSPALRLLYDDQVSRGLRYLGRLLGSDRRDRLPSSGIARVLYLQLEATMYIRLSMQRPVTRVPSLAQVQRIVILLQAESNDYSQVIAHFVQAQQLEIAGEAEQSLQSYRLAHNLAAPLSLVPLQLAATDRIASIQGTVQSGELRRYLASQHVTCPAKLARLYCGIVL